MVGRPLPAFKLDPIIPGKPGVASATFTDGKPRLLNVFASWCVPCAAEAPQLAKLKAAGARIEAVAIRDKAADVQDFIARYGDPFAAVGSDPESEVQLAIGSSGVPETFVVDGKGQIVLQHIGDIRDEDVPGILAALEKAK
ncbi:MAG: DsbE family thiol:disulfide interchange protein [Sphingobium sp.]|nr:DsbE family thiol:disulfide interchange protein [Sphingobium sp.]